MIRTYKTKTGTYSESELAIVLWKNPKKTKRPHSRQLETMTSPNSRYPMAFPVKSLLKNHAFSGAKQVKSVDELFLEVDKSSRANPIIVDLPLAKTALGWSDFYIPEEYVESGIAS